MFQCSPLISMYSVYTANHHLYLKIHSNLYLYLRLVCPNAVHWYWCIPCTYTAINHLYLYITSNLYLYLRLVCSNAVHWYWCIPCTQPFTMQSFDHTTREKSQQLNIEIETLMIKFWTLISKAVNLYRNKNDAKLKV